MGREVKRVDLSFDWPLDKVWEGYVNPHYKKCKNCEGEGHTPARQHLGNIVHLILVAGTDGAKGTYHPWLQRTGCPPKQAPSKDMLELSSGLAGRPGDRIFGHDAVDRWRATQKVIAAAGLDPEKWGVCKDCKGEGIDPKFKKAYDDWKKTEPPAGEGYQIWETVSEGSPISPVFANPVALAAWMEKNDDSITSDMLKEDWLKFIEGSGWSPSLVIENGEVKTGTKWVANQENLDEK